MFSRHLFICGYIITAIAVSIFYSSHLSAEEISAEPVTATAGSFEKKAPVIVNGKELFKVIGVSSYPAEVRARNIAAKIKEAAADKNLDPEKMKVVPTGEVVEIRIDGQRLLGLVQADAVNEGIPLTILTDLVQERIKKAIAEYRYNRTPRVLFIKSGYTLAATLAAALLVWAILRLIAWLDALTRNRFKTRIEKLESKSQYFIRGEMILNVLTGTFRTIKIIAIAIVIYSYLHFVLGLYPWTRMYAERLFSIIIDPLRTILLGIFNSLPNLVFLVILYIVIRSILKLARLFFAGIEKGRITLVNFHKEWALPTYKILRLLIIFFGLVMAYPYIPGSSTDAFKGVSIFLGAILSLGSSSVLSHIIAGYSLIYRRVFRIGDRVKINECIGDIEEMSTLVTRMRSLKNEEIVIPNSIVLNSNVVNYTKLARDKGLILHTTVGIGYEVPWRQVEAMLLQAAEKTPGLREAPRPFVLQQSLGDFAVNYEINAYCNDASQMMQIYTALHKNILDAFNEYGVQIMTPSYVYDTEQPKIVPKDKWYDPPAGTDGGGR